MKNKYNKFLLKALLIFQLIFVGATVNAQELTLDELADKVEKLKPDTSYLYIIGEHAFTSEHALTTQDTMLAARTIKLQDNVDQTVIKNVYDEMTIVYVEATYDNDWNFNGLKYVSNLVGKTGEKETYNINYIDYMKLPEEVEIGKLVEKAYGVINGVAANDKFDVELNGNDIAVTILDASMTSVEALAGTGIATAAEELLNTKGVKSVTLSAAGASVEVNAENLMSKLSELNELFETLASGTNVAGLNNKSLTVKVNLEEGYVASDEDTFTVTFYINELKTSELVEEALGSIVTNNKFEVEVNGNDVTVMLLDTTMTSVEDLAGTGLATAVENLLNTKGVKSVTLSVAGASVEVTAENLMETLDDLDELFGLLAGSTSVKDLDGKTVKVTINEEEGYAVVGNPVFTVTFKKLVELKASELVEEALNTLVTNNKFEVEVAGNAVTVTLLDTTMTSVEDLAGTGIATAAENLLNTKGVKSVTLSAAGASVEVTAENLMSKVSELNELFETLAGTASVKDLDGKTVKVTVNEEKGYTVVGNPVFEVTFKTLKLGVSTLVEEALNTLVTNNKFEVEVNGNAATVTLLDTTMTSVEDLAGTGIATAVEELLNTEGVKSVTLSAAGASVEVTAENLMSKVSELNELFEVLAGTASVKDLDGKTVKVTVNEEEGYLVVGNPVFEVTFKTLKLGVATLVEEALNTLVTNNKFKVALDGNAATVSLIDTTMTSVEDLAGTGIATAVEELLNTEGVKSVTLSAAGANVEVTAENLMSKVSELNELFEVLAGTASVKDLDGKTVKVTVNEEEGYLVVGNPVFEVTFKTLELEVSTLVEEALNTLVTNDKFEVEVNGNAATVTLLDTTMTSVEDLAGTGIATAVEELLNTEGVKSVTLSVAGASVEVTAENLMSKVSELNELFETLAGTASVKDLDGKTVKVTVNEEEDYEVLGNPVFDVTFKTLKLGVSTVVENTLATLPTNDKFELELDGNAATVTLLDRTMTSVEDLAGTGIAAVVEELLNTEGLKSVTLSVAGASVEVTAENLMSKVSELNELFEVLAGSTSVEDLDGKKVKVTVNEEEGYTVVGNPVFEVTFTTLKLGVTTVVENTLATLPSNDKFEVELDGNAATVTLLDTTMTSVEDLAGTGIAAVVEELLNTEGLKSVTLSAAGASVEVTAENLMSKVSELNELFEALAGSTSVKDLDGKTVKVTVNEEEGYEVVGNPVFEVTFDTLEEVNVDNLVLGAFNTIDNTVSEDKFTVAKSGNELTVNVVDTTLDSVYALEGTGIATVANDLLNTEGVNSVVITSEDLPGAKVEVTAANLMEMTGSLQEFFEYLAGTTEPTTLDLIGKSINLEITLKEGYAASKTPEIIVAFE